MINSPSNTYKNYTFSLTIVVFTSLLVRAWGMFTLAPGIVKLLYSFSIWLALVLFPWSWIKLNDFPKSGRLLLNSMLLWGLFEIIRSLFGSSTASNGVGNKYITLLFNEYCSLLFIPPLYAYTVTKYNIVSFLFSLSKKYVIGGIFVSIIRLSFSAISFLSVYLITYWHYVSRRNKGIIIFVYMATFLNALLGARVFYIFFLYSFTAYLSCYKNNWKTLQKTICIASISLPIIFFIPLLSSTTQSEDSFFKTILNFASEKTGDNQEIGSDTRTFLYLEVALDLNNNNSWLIGKGAESSYYSSYFSKTGDDSALRLTVEVPLLLLMLRGGFIYTILYLGLFLLCIYRAIWKGNSRFIRCIGVMLAGWFANLFVGDVSGCSFYHLVLFSLCGLTLSPKWLILSDSEIRNLINTKQIIKI